MSALGCLWQWLWRLLGVAFALKRGRSVLLGRFSEITEPLSEQDLLRLTVS